MIELDHAVVLPFNAPAVRVFLAASLLPPFNDGDALSVEVKASWLKAINFTIT